MIILYGGRTKYTEPEATLSLSNNVSLVTNVNLYTNTTIGSTIFDSKTYIFSTEDEIQEGTTLTVSYTSNNWYYGHFIILGCPA